MIFIDYLQGSPVSQNERDYIMSVVCEASKSQSIEVVVGAYECLVRIMSLYYEKMALYMQQALFAVRAVEYGCKRTDIPS